MAEPTVDLYEFTRALAVAMGPEWCADIPNDDSYHERASIRRVDDGTCAVDIRGPGWYGRHGKLEFIGKLNYNNGHGDGLRYNEKIASINVSATKTPYQVAKDIQRRLLPTYLEQHARNKAYVEAQRAYEATKQSTAEAINAMMRDYTRNHPYESSAFRPSAEVTGATCASLTLDNLPLDLLQRILTMLA